MTHDEKMEAYREIGEKIGLFIGSMTTPTKPDLPDRPGQKWVLDYTWGGSSFAWKLVDDPEGKGTRESPIAWEANMRVKANYWYTHDEHLYVCVKSGSPAEFTNEYFEQMD